jgi:hypothetical protein
VSGLRPPDRRDGGQRGRPAWPFRAERTARRPGGGGRGERDERDERAENGERGERDEHGDPFRRRATPG